MATYTGAGGALRDPAWIQAQIANWLRASGVADPNANPFAQRLLGRANEVGSLADLYDVSDEGRQQFIQNWAGNQWGGQAAPYDFSRQGILNRIAQTGADPNSPLRTGDPEADIATMREWQALANRGRGNRWQQVADVGVQRKGQEFLGSFLNNPNQSAYFSDYFAGRPGQPGAPAGPAPGTANPWAPPVAPRPAVAGPPETPTTTGIPANYNDYTGQAPPPSQTAQAVGAPATQQYRTAMDLYNAMLLGHDPRNLMTSGMWQPGRAFSFGGVTYDPSQQQGMGGRTDRNAAGRFGGGAAWSGMMYRLKQLIDQRNRERAEGIDFPAVPGVGGAATDEELARLAAQWVNQRWRGPTGITVR